MNSKISCAVAAILAGASCGASAVVQAADTTVTSTDTNSEGLVEITVTAQRRNESMQNVPISMQAFTGETLQQLNVTTLDDYLKYLPNVTTANNGPGQNEVFMRGLSAGSERRRRRFPAPSSGPFARPWPSRRGRRAFRLQVAFVDFRRERATRASPMRPNDSSAPRGGVGPGAALHERPPPVTDPSSAPGCSGGSVASTSPVGPPLSVASPASGSPTTPASWVPPSAVPPSGADGPGVFVRANDAGVVDPGVDAVKS